MGAAMEAMDVPCGPINTMDRVFADPQVEARGMRLDAAAQGQPAACRRWPTRCAFPSRRSSTAEGPPLLGQHTREVLQRVLGVADEALRELAAQGAIQETP